MKPLDSEAMFEAAAQLAQSVRGRTAAYDLLEFLENSGGRLDCENQRAVCTLIAGAFSGFCGSALEALRGVVVPGEASVGKGGVA